MTGARALTTLVMMGRTLRQTMRLSLLLLQRKSKDTCQRWVAQELHIDRQMGWLVQTQRSACEQPNRTWRLKGWRSCRHSLAGPVAVAVVVAVGNDAALVVVVVVVVVAAVVDCRKESWLKMMWQANAVVVAVVVEAVVAVVVAVGYAAVAAAAAAGS